MVGSEDCPGQKWDRHRRMRLHASRLWSAGAYASPLHRLIPESLLTGLIVAGQCADFCRNGLS